MLYRFTPHGQVHWNDLPGNLASVVVEHGKDFDDLPDWKPSENSLDETTLRLAMRYGHKSSSGVVVDAGDLVPYDRIRRIREAHGDLVRSRPEYRKTLEQLERIMPGTLEDEDRMNRKLDESTAESVDRATAELEESLQRAPQSEIVTHWKSLGGWLPDPV